MSQKWDARLIWVKSNPVKTSVNLFQAEEKVSYIAVKLSVAKLCISYLTILILSIAIIASFAYFVVILPVFSNRSVSLFYECLLSI